MKYRSLLMLGLSLSSFSALADLPSACPLHLEDYKQGLWTKISGDTGTFVQAKWEVTGRSVGKIKCIYAKGVGELASKFTVVKPGGGNWQQEGDEYICHSISEPEACLFGK
jgi:hypothetical protein